MRALRVLLDISRTIARAGLPTATGIDRVERAYIEWALRQPSAGFLARFDRLVFLLSGDVPRRLLDWFDGKTQPPRMDMTAWLSFQRSPDLRRAQSLVRGVSNVRAPERALSDMLRGAGWDDAAYLNVGHDNLRPVTFRALGQVGLKRVVLLHDVIPLDHPEYARPDTVPKFRSKFDVALGAEALIANSEDTAKRIAHHAAGAMPLARVLHLGIETPSVSPPVSHTGPAIFTALGTIEPRKNHLMLLHLWRQLISELGDEAPHLHIVGRRGWASSEVFGILDGDPMMGQKVHDEGALDDAATRALLLRSRALLFPSLAEGFGLPLGEALAMGVPVLASDLPALRELGGDVPEWLPPSDQNAWRSAITDFADQASSLRAAQLVRLGDWQAPCWDVHFRGVENLLETIMVQPVNHG